MKHPLSLKKLCVNMMLSCITLLVCFLVCEIGIRVLQLAPDIFLQQDDILGVWHIPNKTGVYFRKDVPKTPVRINSHGLRDHEYSLKKRENTYRIAVLGDSFSEAIQVPLEQSYHQRLEAQFQALSSPRSIEVINFGIGGYGTTHEYLTFMHRVLAYEPDMMLLQFMFGNDIYENSPLLNGRNYLPYLIPRQDGSFMRQPPTPVPFYMRLGATFKTIPFLYYRLVDGNPKFEMLLRGIKRGNEETYGFPYEYMMFAEEWEQNWTDAWEITQQVLLRLHREALTRQLLLVVIGIPDQVQVNAAIQRELFETYPAMQQYSWNWQKPNTLLQQFCETQGIHFFDLSPILMKNIEHEETAFYYHYDGHWNTYGHRLAAESIMKWLYGAFPEFPEFPAL